MTDRRFLFGCVIAFAGVSLVLAAASTGFLEADGITHYLYARWAWTHPFLLADVWGRPVVTTLHAVPAKLGGVLAVRATSLLVAIGCALIAWRAAADLGGRGPGLAGVFTLASPLVLLHSFSVLTELPFALLSVACLWAYLRRRWAVLALLAGLLPAARPEGFGFLAIAVVGLALHRRWAALPLASIGLVMWSLAGWLLTGRPEGGPWLWLPRSWPYSGESAYAAGPLWKFAGMLPAAVGPGLTPFVLIGAWRCLRRGTADDAVVAGVPLFVLAVHSLLHWTGTMASSGDVRYLVAVAPFWGLLAWRGFEAFDFRRPHAAAAALAVVPWLAMQAIYPVVPLVHTGDAREAVELVAPWLESDGAANLLREHPDLRVDHPAVMLAAGLDPLRRGSADLAADRPAGVAWVWHEVYSRYNADGRLTVEADVPPRLGWRDATPAGWPRGWRLFLSDPAGVRGSRRRPGLGDGQGRPGAEDDEQRARPDEQARRVKLRPRHLAEQRVGEQRRQDRLAEVGDGDELAAEVEHGPVQEAVPDCRRHDCEQGD